MNKRDSGRDGREGERKREREHNDRKFRERQNTIKKMNRKISHYQISRKYPSPEAGPLEWQRAS